MSQASEDLMKEIASKYLSEGDRVRNIVDSLLAHPGRAGESDAEKDYAQLAQKYGIKEAEARKMVATQEIISQEIPLIVEMRKEGKLSQEQADAKLEEIIQLDNIKPEEESYRVIMSVYRQFQLKALKPTYRDRTTFNPKQTQEIRAKLPPKN